jgi:hypothetical protein
VQLKFYHYRFSLYLIAFILAFGRFLPLPFAPQSFHQFFSTWGAILFIPFFALLLFFVFFVFIWNIALRFKPKFILLESFSILLLFFCFILLTPTFINWSNIFTVWLNQNNSADELYTPILGLRKKDCRKTKSDCRGEVMFVTNEIFFIYDALVFDPAHGKETLNKNDEGLEGVRKAYDKDWYWYHETD